MNSFVSSKSIRLDHRSLSVAALLANSAEHRSAPVRIRAPGSSKRIHGSEPAKPSDCRLAGVHWRQKNPQLPYRELVCLSFGFPFRVAEYFLSIRYPVIKRVFSHSENSLPSAGDYAYCRKLPVQDHAPDSRAVDHEAVGDFFWREQFLMRRQLRTAPRSACLV